MGCDFVLVGAQSECSAGFYVLREVINVKGFSGVEMILGDGVFVNFLLGFDETNFVG